MSTLNHTGFRAQLFTKLDQRITDKDQVLRMFSEDKGRARRLYRLYMRESGGAQREDIYATIDQRVLGDERFVEKVMGKTGRRGLRGKRRHEYTLAEIGGAVEKLYGITLRQLREKGRDERIQSGRRLISLVAREYGYRGQETTEYLWRDPAGVTRYLKERKSFETDIEKVHEILSNKRRKLNNQV